MTTDEGLLAEVRAVLAEVPLVDGHNDLPWKLRKRFAGRVSCFDFTDTTRLDPPLHTDLRRLRQGGVGAQFWSLFLPLEHGCEGGPQGVLELMDLVHHLVWRYKEHLEMACTADDVERIHAEGRVACLMGVEGGQCINDSLPVLRQLYRAGARYLTLTQWNTSRWADSATDVPLHDGLTPFGRRVVCEMNRLGMLVDLSHVSVRTMEDVLDVTASPVVFSHSGARAVCGHPRNVPDSVLTRVAGQGGVVMVNFSRYFTSEEMWRWDAEREGARARLEALHLGDPLAVEAGLEAWTREHPEPAVVMQQVADHIDHIREVAGIEHVGLGSDFDGIEQAPVGLEDVSRFPHLLVELLRRGYTREDLARVAGGNILRVLRDNEREAGRLGGAQEPCDAAIGELDGPGAGAR